MATPAADDDLVLVGKVIKAHSIRGEVKVYPYSEAPEQFLQYREVRLVVDQQTVPVAHTISRARVQKNILVLQLRDCTTRNDAEQLVQAAVYVHKDDMPEPEPDEFYLRDLEGRAMKTEEGELIGIIDGVMLGSSQNVVRVKNQGEEYLIPIIPEFLLAIDADEVTVSLPPGLLEINA